MTHIGKFDGNVNNRFLFGQRGAAETPKKAEAKDALPLTQKGGGNKDINLNNDPNALYSTMGLSLSKTTLDKNLEKLIDAKTLNYIQNTPEATAKRIGSTAVNTYAALAAADEDDPFEAALGALPAKYQPTAEQRERIGSSVAKFESYFA